jgi:hypothetical protein
VSLIVNSGGQSIAVLTGTAGLVAHQIFGPDQPDAATYMKAPPRADMPSVEQPAQPLVGALDSVYGTFFANVPNPQPKCKLVDDVGTAITVRGLGAAPITDTTTDDVIVWTSTGKLLLYPGDVFNGPAPFGASCTGGQTGPLAGSGVADTGFLPSKGSQIVMIDGKYALLVGHKEIGDSASYLGLYDVTAGPMGAKNPTRIGNPVTLPDLRTATVLDTANGRFIAAGYPTATFDGVKAGKVLLLPLSVTTGITETPAATLHDASPESDQAFGRAVAAMPYNGKNILAVAADNEIFVYFRTTLYDETRIR